ncbi:glycosyltransferase family 9 protein [Crossiella sp. CA-258035]|uniref:glycosyltransferase family 9 protein n=1 Tax=Crossiella sp. CA-258035 TaxID=2981138 RepID=UPI0024BC6FD6|nr:glycosyltransferase family 9 protein [Crossiella sp. CA-258035]WHT15935.1 glycosyltransferase family 9 protein [Crossiella sp. CA-258035]
MSRVLVCRLDSEGDVLLAGPAIRAIAHTAEVTLLCGPRGAQAAGLLPGVSTVLTWHCPWIDPEPEPVRPQDFSTLVDTVRGLGCDRGVILTSFHQSPLPTALALRLAGIGHLTAASVDYPGSLLDIRLRPGQDLAEDQPEAGRALAIAAAAGFPLPPGDDGRLAITGYPGTGELTGPPGYVVLHPGASVPARSWPPRRCAEAVAELVRDGHRVVVTGGPGETGLTAEVAGSHALDLGGRTSFAELAGVLARAAAVVVGNTGPAHLAAAVGTPVVSLFAPVVPAIRWAPHGPHVLLGDQWAPCRDSRARVCPVPGHPCLDGVPATAVAEAVRSLLGVTV